MSWTSDSDDNPRNDDQARDPYAAPDPDQPGQQPSGERPPQQPDHPPGYPPAYAQPPAWSEAPGGDAGGQPSFGQAPYGEPAPSGPPKSILNAVKLMYVGAGLAVLTLLASFFARDEIREQTIDSAINSGMSESEAESFADGSVGFIYVVAAITIGLWIWMARANRRGKTWARVTATVLGGLNIVFTLGSLASGGSAVNLIVSLVTLALAAYILWLLYRPESTMYYKASSRRL